MDIKTYIASGILELYALDQLSPPERAEVERYVEQYPELRKELLEIEQSLEIFAQAQAVTPPAKLIPGIHQKIDQLEAAPANAVSSTGASNWWKAIAGLLTVGLLTMSYFYFQSRQTAAQLASLQEQLSNCEERAAVLNNLQQQIALAADPSSQFIELAGTPDHQNAQASIIYNTQSQQTLFAAQGLPNIPADRQYQLWAIIDGATISLGVFDAPGSESPLFIAVPFEAEVDAFAITLEPQGGSINPTLEQMYVIGQTG